MCLATNVLGLPDEAEHSAIVTEEGGEKPGWRCHPHFRADLGPFLLVYLLNNFGPNNFGIWSRFTFPSVPGTEKAMSTSCGKERKAGTSLTVPGGTG